MSLEQLLAELGARFAGKNPRVLASGNAATPVAFLAQLDGVLENYMLHALNACPGIPDRPGVTYESTFIGAGMRPRAEDPDGLHYVPGRLSQLPLMLNRSIKPDVVVAHVSRPEDWGGGTHYSLGIEVNVLPAAIDAAHANGGVVIAVVNENMPYTFGDGEMPAAAFDYVVELTSPLHLLPAPLALNGSTGPHSEIGARIAEHVPSGSTLQLGIGAVPDAVLAALKNRHGLRLWSEMFSDGIMLLDQLGAMDHSVPLTASFSFGSEELMRWIDGNRRILMLRTEIANDPARIAMHTGMVSINSALQVDLFDQANASRVGTRIYSGFGGQPDFVEGALHAPDGKSFIALTSWHAKADVSTIVGRLQAPLTSVQHTAVVTENGIAYMWGRSQGEQALNLIERAAHPNAREELHSFAHEHGLLR